MFAGVIIRCMGQKLSISMKEKHKFLVSTFSERVIISWVVAVEETCVDVRGGY